MSEEIKALTTEVEHFIAKTNEEVEAHGSIGRKNSEGLKALEDKVAAQNEAMADMEQKLASADKRVAEAKAASMSLGQSVVAHERFAEFQARGGRANFEVQANTVGSDSASGTALTSVGTGADRLGGVFAAFKPLNVLDVITKGVTSSNLVEFAQESSSTNAAAGKDEAAALDESTLNFTLAQEPVQLIGTFVKISRQCRDDAPQLASFVDSRLTYFVNRKLEDQVINGNNTSPNLHGILSTGGSTNMSAGAGNIIDDCRDMLTQLQINGFNASAFFLNPTNLASIDKAQAGGSDATYIAADPRANNAPVLWGVPVVVSDQVPLNTGIVGDWAAASALHMREGAVVEMFEQDGTNVQSNLITVRASVRAAYCTYNAGGVIETSFA